MERQTLFRAKRADNNTWVYGGITSANHTIDGKTYIVSNEFNENDDENERIGFTEVMPETVGQYSHRKEDLSIQGEKMLFEGDVCEVCIEKPRSPNYNGFNCETAQFKAEVIFDGGAFKFRNLTKGKTWKAWHTRQMYAMDLSSPKVIGNIHDNPELLK